LKLAPNGHKASRGLSATAELLVISANKVYDYVLLVRKQGQSSAQMGPTWDPYGLTQVGV